MKEMLKDHKRDIMFFLLLVNAVDEASSRTKFIYGRFMGSGVSFTQKAKVSVRLGEIAEQFPLKHVSMDADETMKDWNPETWAKELLRIGGAHKPTQYDFGPGAVYKPKTKVEMPKSTIKKPTNKIKVDPESDLKDEQEPEPDPEAPPEAAFEPEPELVQQTQQMTVRMDLKQWMRDVVKLPHYYQLLREDGFDDLESVQDVTEDDLKEMGIDKTSHRRKIMKFVVKLKQWILYLHRNSEHIINI